MEFVNISVAQANFGVVNLKRKTLQSGSFIRKENET